MNPPLTLSEAHERYIDVVDELDDAKWPERIEELGRELRGLQRLICWLRDRERRAA